MLESQEPDTRYLQQNCLGQCNATLETVVEQLVILIEAPDVIGVTGQCRHWRLEVASLVDTDRLVEETASDVLVVAGHAVDAVGQPGELQG